jgi:hypothetical protein
MVELREREIPRVNVSRLDGWLQSAYNLRIQKVASLYHTSWAQEGLSHGFTEALEKVTFFDASQAWVATGGAIKPHGVLHTVGIHALTLDTLYARVQTYAHVEGLAGMGGDQHVSMRLCFSLAAPQKIRVTSPGDFYKKTIAEVLLRSLPKNRNERVIAFSRTNAYDNSMPIVDFVKHGFGDSRMLGAVGLHEHLGGLTLAVLTGSRPEDVRSGGANILVAYPMNEKEEALFAALRAKRKEVRSALETRVHAGDFGRAMHVFVDSADCVPVL